MGRVALLACVGACVAGSAKAQVSTLYVTDGDADDIRAVQGGVVVDSNLDVGGSRRYRVAVRDTIWLGDMDLGTNIELDLDLDPTGSSSPSGVDIQEGTDGTTDGTFNYTVESFVASGFVYRYNGDWSGGSALFQVTGSDIVGITYDTATDTLWISDNSTISQYDLAGNVLGSFPHAGGRGSLAYEPATDTLWYVTNGSDSIRQYSKAGALLQTLSVPGLASNNWGAEFALAAGCPDPNECGDWDGSGGQSDGGDFFAYLDSFAGGDPCADIDGNPGLDGGDFFAFLDRFVLPCP
ncbi:MAG: hypothetical protein H6811_07810 [Phycisphaeraceae bacterium]|nr:hypothetical protein [Phycisphaeraceae bacterium]